MITSLKERNQKIKKAVCLAFPNDKVSVIGGRGTATGWVDVKVTLKPSKECTCNFVEKTATWSKEQYKYIQEKKDNQEPETITKIDIYIFVLIVLKD